jgi:hypothetical protein
MIVVMPSAVFVTCTAFGSWSVEAIGVEARLFWQALYKREVSSRVQQWFLTTILNNHCNPALINTLLRRLGSIVKHMRGASKAPSQPTGHLLRGMPSTLAHVPGVVYM